MADGDSDDGYDDVTEVNRFLGLDTQGIENSLVGRVADVCHRSGAHVPTSMDDLVGHIDGWLGARDEVNTAAAALETDPTDAAARGRELTVIVVELEMEATERAVAASAQALNVSSRQSSLEAEVALLCGFSAENKQLRTQLSAVYGVTEKHEGLRGRLATASDSLRAFQAREEQMTGVLATTEAEIRGVLRMISLRRLRG